MINCCEVCGKPIRRELIFCDECINFIEKDFKKKEEEFSELMEEEED